MATIERITSTGDADKDAEAVQELHKDFLDANITYEQALEREDAARAAALEPPRNALVEQPYAEGETIEVIVHEGDAEDVSASASDKSGADESVVDRQKATLRKTLEGTTTRQAAASPQPAVTTNQLTEGSVSNS